MHFLESCWYWSVATVNSHNLCRLSGCLVLSGFYRWHKGVPQRQQKRTQKVRKTFHVCFTFCCVERVLYACDFNINVSTDVLFFIYIDNLSRRESTTYRRWCLLQDETPMRRWRSQTLRSRHVGSRRRRAAPRRGGWWSWGWEAGRRQWWRPWRRLQSSH